MIHQRLTLARRWLGFTVLLVALLWALAAALGMAAMMLVFNRFAGPGLAAFWPALPGIAALVSAGTIAWRARHLGSNERMALWLEEQVGGLDHLLVTAADSAASSPERHPELHRLAGEVNPVRVIGRTLRRWSVTPILVSAIAVGVVYLAGPLARLDTDAHSARTSRHSDVADRLAGVVVKVTPPEYSGLPSATLKSPESVAALVGSHLVIQGKGAAEGVLIRRDGSNATSKPSPDGWVAELTMPPQPSILSLAADTSRRLIALLPILDSVPVVRLRLPADDTTYQAVPGGTLSIEASLSDDIGLESAQVEYMVTTGSEEDFQTRSTSGVRHVLAGSRKGLLQEQLRFDTLRLAPGSVLHIRVVAFDRNTVTGPGKGISETRTLRIAEPVDSTDAEATPPPPIDSMFISQRLLNLKTDTLVASRRALGAAVSARRSDDYSLIQESLRQHTLSVIGEIEGDADDPSSTTTAISRQLRQAAELMATARTHLAAGDPVSATPFMRRILKILDTLRLANRYYLRGRPRPRMVDLARTRLTGTDPGREAVRTPRPAAQDTREPLRRRLEALLSSRDLPPAALRDSLIVIRVHAAGVAPGVGLLLAAAIDSIDRRVPLSQAVAPVRHALETAPTIESPVAPWAPLP